MTTCSMAAEMSHGYSRGRNARFVPRRTLTSYFLLFVPRSIPGRRLFRTNCLTSRNSVQLSPWPSPIFWIGFLRIPTNRTWALEKTSSRLKRRYTSPSSKTLVFTAKTKTGHMCSALLLTKRYWSSGTLARRLWQRQWIGPERSVNSSRY